MARSLCPDKERASVAVGAAILALLVPSAAGQVGAIAAGGLIGWGLLANAAPAQRARRSPCTCRAPGRSPPRFSFSGC